MPVEIKHGDAIAVLRDMPAASIDAVVTDPPYALDFMGHGWDRFTPAEFQAWCDGWAKECHRVLKPGGHLLAFGGTRTWHRLTCGIEDAGFEIRDTITWLYGSGFPKSLDVSKAITATQRNGGANSVWIRQARMGDGYRPSGQQGNWDGIGRRGESGMALGDDPERYRPTELTDDARRWAGWGTALKPASEPIVVARKPLAGTVAANVLARGTGAINIDAARVHADDAPAGRIRHGGGIPGNGSSYELPDARPESPAGRWPANVVLSHSAAPDGGDACADGCVEGCPVAELDAQTGGASRFFPTFRYQAKAPTRERPKVNGVAHPTVKPLELIRWLVRLVTPPGGTVLDPFAGSGTTGQACALEGMDCVLIEREEKYLPLIEQRLARIRIMG